MSTELTEKSNYTFILSTNIFGKHTLTCFEMYYRLSPRSAADLFEFCWTLFLCVKSSLRISDDLVNSYHLLLASTDLVFYNVAHANRKSLLTPKFQGINQNKFLKMYVMFLKFTETINGALFYCRVCGHGRNC